MSRERVRREIFQPPRVLEDLLTIMPATNAERRGEKEVNILKMLPLATTIPPINAAKAPK